jgi:hypothetical protein
MYPISTFLTLPLEAFTLLAYRNGFMGRGYGCRMNAGLIVQEGERMVAGTVA